MSAQTTHTSRSVPPVLGCKVSTSSCSGVARRLKGYPHNEWAQSREHTCSCAASQWCLSVCRLFMQQNAWLLGLAAVVCCWCAASNPPLLSCTSMVTYTTFGRCAHFTVGSNILLFGLQEPAHSQHSTRVAGQATMPVRDTTDHMVCLFEQQTSSLQKCGSAWQHTFLSLHNLPCNKGS